MLLASQGFAIPAAIAAKLSCPDRQVCCVVGDGGYYMMAGEMSTALRLSRNIVFVVLIDSSLSLIRIKQEKKGNSQYGTQLDTNYCHQSSQTLFGVPVFSAKTLDEYTIALDKAFNENGPVIVEAYIDTKDYEDLVLKGNR
jgi:acetolactate synthase-1/2/3 large subunit